VTDPIEEVKSGIVDIGRTLAGEASLTSAEKQNIVKWTEALVIALASGDHNAVENYRVSLSTMLGVAEVRGAQASEKALLRVGQFALETLIKVGLAAI
jgi:hypothetical protein